MRYIAVVAVAASVTFVLAFLILKLSHRFRLYPKIRERDVHTRPTPRLGGVAMFIGVIAGFAAASQFSAFDPVFEDCCAPINLKSLKRFTPPPCEIEDLPVIDVVVISHNHYDHLSYPTIKRIQKKDPDVHFFAPLGNKKWFEACGITNCTELDWWETRDVKLEVVKSTRGSGEEKVDSVAVTPSAEEVPRSTATGEHKSITATIGALPCQHVTARTPFDKCKTLWASWSVESGGSKVYFAGYVPRPYYSFLYTS